MKPFYLLLLLSLLLSPVAAQQRGGYNLFPIALLLTAAYLLTRSFASLGYVTLAEQRAFWNIVLLIFFLISGGLGILLVLMRDYGLQLSLPFSPFRVHILSGIVMVVVSTFHILWHAPYFKALFRRSI